jgi:hypothetical protein
MWGDHLDAPHRAQNGLGMAVGGVHCHGVYIGV